MTFESFDRRVVRLWRSKLHHLGIDGSVEVHTTTLLLLRFLFGWRVVRAVVMVLVKVDVSSPLIQWLVDVQCIINCMWHVAVVVLV